MTLTVLTIEEFQNYSEKVTHRSFVQSVQMGDLMEKRGAKVVYLSLKNEEEIQVAAMIFSLPMFGGLYMELYSGPIYTEKSALERFYNDLKVYAKQQNVLELQVKPYDIYQTFDSDGNATSDEEQGLITTLTALGYHFDGLKSDFADWLYYKDLSGLTDKTLLNSFSKKGKPLVKKAETFGIQLKKLKREELSIFKDITRSTSERREYSDKSLEYYEKFYDAFGNQAEFLIATLNFSEYLSKLESEQAKLEGILDKLRLDLSKNPNSEKKQNQLREYSSQFETFEVRKAEARDLIDKYGDKDVVLAGSLFVYMPQETSYLFSGSYTEFNKFYAPAVLQKYVMLESIKRGIQKYNFLGIEGVFDGSDGVLRFKQNFNGYIVRKAGTFRYYPKPLKFKAISLIKKLLRR